jgi:chromate transporter
MTDIDMTAAPEPVATGGAAQPGTRPSFREALRVWMRVAALSFGGPAGQIAVMHRILVDEKKWISEARFLHALNFCMLLPGPEAQQLATYCGWLLHGVKGGLAAGLLFIAPGVVAIMGLSIVYALFGHVGLIAGLFFGLKAAVLAIVLQALVRIGSRALKTRTLMALAAASFVAIFALGVPFPLIILAAAIIGYMAGKYGWKGIVPAAAHGNAGEGEADNLVEPPARGAHIAAAIALMLWLAMLALLIWSFGWSHAFTQVGLFFSKMALVTFGGAYAVLAYVAQEAVGHYGWLTAPQMLDGLGMAETTPGPLIMVVQFVGFMAGFNNSDLLPDALAGAIAGLIATWVTFAPCFVWIFAGAPYIERLRANRALASALGAITAAVVGVILNLAIWFTIHTLFRVVEPFRAGPLQFDAPVWTSVDLASLAIAAAAMLATFRFKVGMIPTLAGACLAGLLIQLLR